MRLITSPMTVQRPFYALFFPIMCFHCSQWVTSLSRGNVVRKFISHLLRRLHSSAELCLFFWRQSERGIMSGSGLETLWERGFPAFGFIGVWKHRMNPQSQPLCSFFDVCSKLKIFIVTPHFVRSCKRIIFLFIRRFLSSDVIAWWVCWYPWPHEPGGAYHWTRLMRCYNHRVNFQPRNICWNYKWTMSVGRKAFAAESLKIPAS